MANQLGKCEIGMDSYCLECISRMDTVLEQAMRSKQSTAVGHEPFCGKYVNGTGILHGCCFEDRNVQFALPSSRWLKHDPNTSALAYYYLHIACAVFTPEKGEIMYRLRMYSWGCGSVGVTQTNFVLQVWGNLVGFIERLDDELFKSLQVLDPHTNLYLERMKDEPLFLALAQKVSPALSCTLTLPWVMMSCCMLSQLM